MTKSLGPSEVGGSLRAPASKSSMQRAIACALLARGRSVIRNPSWCADSLAAASVAEALGARLTRSEEELVVEGAPPLAEGGSPGGVLGGSNKDVLGVAPGAARRPSSEGEVAPVRALDCGESGLCIRMFSPIAALYPGVTELSGRGSLLDRSVAMVEAPLRAFGASCSTRNGFPPVRVGGPIRGGRIGVEGRESSQFLTGLLIALAAAENDSILSVQGIVSRGYVDLTLDTMRAFGVEASRDEAFGEFRIRGGQSYRATDFEVEGDWSGAAFLLVAGALAARSEALDLRGLQAGSSQPDRAIMEVLALAGAGIEWRGDAVLARRADLKPFIFDATDCPDLFPPIVALAAACAGESRIHGANRLKGKESDRALALSSEFASLGVEVLVEGDLMRVRGGRIRGGSVDSRNDHRIAMAAAVASLVAEESVSISRIECVAKSWPGFFEDLKRITRGRT